MNYLRQINGFNRYTEQRQTVSAGAQLLYYKLLDKANMAGWADWIQVGTGTLMVLISVESKKKFYNLRDELVELGLIEVDKGKRGKLPRYRIIKLSGTGEFINSKEEELGEELGNISTPNNDPNIELGNIWTPNLEPNMAPNSAPNMEPNLAPNNIPKSAENKVPSLENYNTSIINKTKLNKTKLNNNSLDNTNVLSLSSSDDEKVPSDNFSANSIKDFWNQHHGAMPKITSVRGKRLTMVKARIKEFSEGDVRVAILNAEKSDFLNGSNNRGWMANFDWIFKPNNFPKVLEGNYNNQSFQPIHQNSFNQKQEPHDVFWDIAMAPEEENL